MISAPSLAQRLPDLPRWVEARALLLGDPCEIFGLQEIPALAFVLRDPESNFVFVIGTPAVAALETALQQNGGSCEVVAPMEQAAWLAAALPGWQRSRIIVHRLAEPQCLPEVPVGAVRFLDPSMLAALPMEAALREELQSGAAYSPIAATVVGEQPVAFCYAGSTTETLWDVSIDTLPAHRRQGHAALCASYMVQHMRGLGKEPVWQSLEENPASWKLAHKLGFAPVDELVLFAPRNAAEPPQG